MLSLCLNLCISVYKHPCIHIFMDRIFSRWLMVKPRIASNSCTSCFRFPSVLSYSTTSPIYLSLRQQFLYQFLFSYVIFLYVPVFVDSSQWNERPTLPHHDLILINCRYNYPIFNQCHILRYWEL